MVAWFSVRTVARNEVRLEQTSILLKIHFSHQPTVIISRRFASRTG
jgi:hypothetical protein